MNTEILVITDRSGSMASIASDVIGGYNRFIDDQRSLPGEARVTYTQFDTEYEVIYAGTALKKVPVLDDKTFVPRGGTALLDAIGRTLNEQGARIAKEGWAELVIVLIVTDGEENSSREYDRARIKEMTSHAESNGWKFVYLGANQDAFSVARGLGFSTAHTQGYDATSAGTQAAYGIATASVGHLRAQPKP